MRAKPHYTTGELAKILKVGATKVTQLVDSGELPGWRGPFGARYVPHPMLVRWLRGRPGSEATLKRLGAA